MFTVRYTSRYKQTASRFVVAAAAIIIAAAGGLHDASGQTGQTVYFMNRLPQSSLLNPAIQHPHSFHIGIPMLSSFNVNARTNFASFSDFVFKHPQYDSLITFLHPDANIDDFASKLRERNTISPELYLNLINFGFGVDRHYFSFGISERNSLRAFIPKDLVMLGLFGNEQFTGKKADFSEIGIDLNYFREYAAGYSYQLTDDISVGGRAKLLFGKAAVSFDNSDISLYTEPDTYNTLLRSDITVNMSLPVTIIRDQDGFIDEIRPHFDDEGYDPLDWVFNSGNAGFAVDIGATYRLMEPLTLFASITDLGFISWQEDVYNLKIDGEFEFDGIDLSPAFDAGDDSKPLDNLIDTLDHVFGISDTSNPFTRGLPARIYLGGTYDLYEMLSLGLLSRSEIYRGRLEQAVTLSAQTNVGRWLSASLSWTAMNNSYNNLGFGLALTAPGFQFYVVSDNLNSTFMPHRTNSVNLWFGLNLVFGRRTTLQPDGNELVKDDIRITGRK